ncbi:NADH oxidase [Spironucleus salmonicida]|uniref:NADH oxidase n=1 Tax=Spironucleus salmonicida TaxID=348837 RepID=V6LQR7_9EUKA|nr:NADH oxidase [Spironucleus salmonicida]|eukprot:EST46593.1 NADH oxidase [Spironucleus salmonicida]
MGCGQIQLQYAQPKFQNEKDIDLSLDLDIPIIQKQVSNHVVIIGCTHAGTVAAAVLRNGSKAIQITIFEKNQTISFLSCGIHLALMGVCTNLNQMFYNSIATLKSLDIEVQDNTEVQQIDYGARIVYFKNQSTCLLGSINYDKLIIATGSKQYLPKLIKMNSPRILFCKNYNDTLKLLKLKFKTVAILGAGHIGTELAYALTEVKAKVKLIDQSQRIMQKYFEEFYTDIIQDEFLTKGAELFLGQQIKSVESTDTGVCILFGDQQIEAEFVILAAGFSPNTKMVLQSDNLKILKHNNTALQVNSKQETSILNVYAAGDCCQIFNNSVKQDLYLPLATHAIRQGAVAAYQILGKDITMQGTQGSFGIQIFSFALACTGISSDTMGIQNIAKIMLSEDIIRNFTPTEDDISSIIIIFSEVTFKILGCQIMGTRDSTGLVDLVSMAISQNMTIQELSMIEISSNSNIGPFMHILQKVCLAAFLQVPRFEKQQLDEQIE